MAIDLNKDKNELKYYYSENGATLGPLTLSQLLEKIDAETLVYREGMDWTNAKDVEELKKFFSLKINNQTDKIDETDKKKTKRSGLIAILIVLIILAIWFVFNNKLKNNDTSVTEPIEAKIYANAKKRNKLVIGTLSIKEATANFNSCMKEVFGDRFIKYSQYEKIDQALDDMAQEETDILILSENETKDIKGMLDISESIVWEGYSQNVFIAVPKNNETHLKSIQNCIKNNDK
jgi:hypothetical protein